RAVLANLAMLDLRNNPLDAAAFEYVNAELRSGRRPGIDNPATIFVEYAALLDRPATVFQDGLLVGQPAPFVLRAVPVGGAGTIYVDVTFNEEVAASPAAEFNRSHRFGPFTPTGNSYPF